MKQLQEKNLYYLKAQLPFNTKKTEEINLSYYNDGRREKRDIQDFMIMMNNLKKLNVCSEVYKKDIRFLDIGYGSGKLLQHFYEKGLGLYYGIEPLTEIYKRYLFNIDNLYVQNTDIEHYEPQVSFHIIHSFFVLEHMINPLIMFEKAYEWLVSGGKLIITCPNSDCWIKGRHEIESHRWLPDRKTLIKIANGYGFKVNKYFTYGGFSAPRNKLKELGNNIIKFFNKGDVVCMMLEKK